MDSRTPAVRQAMATMVSGIALAAGGAVAMLAWQARMWASLTGAGIVVGWTVGLACWTALRRHVPATGGYADPEEDAPLLPALLDQVPVPLVRVAAARGHAINRAARTLFATDDVILPLPPALLDRSAPRLRHASRGWRIDAVDTARDGRLIALIDVEAEERAAEDRAADEMIDILGHELLNGLSPIVSLADSAMTAASRGDAMLGEILATLTRRVEGLEGFTRAYRTLARLPDPVRADVPLAQLAGDLSHLFASRFAGAVSLTLDVGDARASADRDQLTQAIWALLQNAAEAALAGNAPPAVTLAMRVGATGLSVTVRDSGTGVPAPDRARIFRPFHTTKPSGSGIGLSLARRIARGHGGDLHLLDDTATTFDLRVPQ